MKDPLLTEIYQNGGDLCESVKKLLGQGCDPNMVTEYGESPLRVASNYGRFEVVQLLLKAGADATQLCWTGLFHATAFGSAKNLKNLLDKGADLAARDFWDRTPWLLSLQVGNIEKAELLLAAGSDPAAVGRCGKTPMAYAILSGQIRMLTWLIDQDFDIEAVDDFGDTAVHTASELAQADCLRILIDAGADVSKEDRIPERPIAQTEDLEIISLLVAAGEDLNDVSAEGRAKLLGLDIDEDPQVSKEDYATGKDREFGRSNPELADKPFWTAMVKCGATAWRPRSLFGDTEYGGNGPVWCYHRFGKSIIDLGDGTYIEIAGEHEDSYDPDFCIYNDVFHHKGDGEFDIYIYPEEVFPPTDFHTATPIDRHIYIIGNLGYPKDRQPGYTPVYRLSIDSFKIEKVETTGENPGWISNHKATCQDGTRITIKGGKVIATRDDKEFYEDNRCDYRLSLETLEWTRIT